MKGLLIKDLYMAFRHCGILLVIALVFIGVSIADADNALFAFFPALFAGVVPLTVMSYDEQCKWNEYADGLPYSRAQMVSVKYILGLLCFVPLCILSVAGFMLRAAVLQQPVEAAQLCADAALLFAVNLLFPACTLPFFFRFGANKGRIAYYAVIGAFFAFVAALGISSFGAPAAEPIAIPAYAAYIFLGCAALLFAISWLLSVWFYRKREF